MVKMKDGYLTRPMLLLTALLLATPSGVYAYVDPGAGAFLYQAAYAVFLGGVYTFRRFLKRVWGRPR
jgi:hypothetical protein